MCAVLSAIACSVDARSLSLTSAEDQGNAGQSVPDEPSSVGGSNGGAGGDDSALIPDAAANDPDAGDDSVDEPSSDSSCDGKPRERRCAIAGGTFELGPTDAPVPSQIASFRLDELEVTVGRFRQYLTNFSGAPAADAGAHPAIEHSGWRTEWTALLPASKEKLIESLHCNADWQTWTDDPGDREDYPLTCANYYVAFAFCAWSGGRLPTEAEWEYAASGGAQQRRYPWGNEEPSFERAAFDTTAIAPAGAHRAGMARFGQLDLAGSAWEWTLDFFREYPEACQQCAEVERGSERVLRGGAFLYDAEYLKPSYRFHLDPQLALGDVGFRCAYEL
ncbi:MAG TPA: SUMF1/EgtB/PvdO family nonheme iron enzyme [Polyangiaceae bacterium]